MAGETREERGARRNRLRAFWRKRLRPVWRDLEWPLVGAIWAFGLVLGIIGFGKSGLAAGTSATFWDVFYRALQLIVLQSGDVPGPLPWQLEAARFVMPAVAGYAAIQALLAIFREQWHRFGLRLVKGHAVVCGLGARGLRLTQDLLDHGFRVVVVEKDEANAFADRCRELGAVVLAGDATDEDVLRRAGVGRARYLISVCADDGANVETALRARALVKARPGRPLDAFVHIEDLELCNLLGGSELSDDGGSPIKVEFFNVLERGARLMLETRPPIAAAAGRRPRILIVGLGKMGRSLAVQAARNWWLSRAGEGPKLSIGLVDQAASMKSALLRVQNPQLDEACALEAWELQKNDPRFEQGDFLFDKDGRIDVDAVYICFDDDVHVLVDALTLFRKTRPHEVPIVMRMSREGGLAALLKEPQGASAFGLLHVFGILDRTCVLEALLGGRREILARAIHEDYRRQQQAGGATAETNPSMAPWNDLPEDLRESNRDQADDIEAKLAAIGCGIQSLTDWRRASFERMPKDVRSVFDVERLARMEHERWWNERRRQGWTLGPKDLGRRASPYLVPWEQLPGEIQEYDRNAVRGMPSILARAGLQIYRKV